MCVHVHYWIRVRRHPNVADAPDHYLWLIMRIRELDMTTQLALRPTIQRGAYYAHEESILLALLCSSDRTRRLFAVGYQFRILIEAVANIYFRPNAVFPRSLL